jgi:hypothetical protein
MDKKAVFCLLNLTVLNSFIIFASCGAKLPHLSSQHSFRQLIFTVLCQFIVRSTNSCCSLAACVVMSSLQSHCAWKNDLLSTLSRCVLLCSNCAHSLSQMSLALVEVSMSSATDLLSVHAIMLAVLASFCHHSVPFSAESVHLQGGQGTFEIHQ